MNNWDNQFYATSLLLWQLTGNTTYEDKVEVRHVAFDSGALTDKFGRNVDNINVLDAVVSPHRLGRQQCSSKICRTTNTIASMMLRSSAAKAGL